MTTELEDLLVEFAKESGATVSEDPYLDDLMVTSPKGQVMYVGEDEFYGEYAYSCFDSLNVDEGYRVGRVKDLQELRAHLWEWAQTR